MAKVEVILPQMGEGIIEATITRWLIEVDSEVDEDEPLVEIATDKVDSEVPSPVSGKLIKCFYSESEIPKVGDVIAIIEDENPEPEEAPVLNVEPLMEPIQIDESKVSEEKTDVDEIADESETILETESNISLFIKQFANLRGVSIRELNKIVKDKNQTDVSKSDVLQYVKDGRPYKTIQKQKSKTRSSDTNQAKDFEDYIARDGETVINIDRTRTLIANHMVRSVQTAPHVTSFVEADITALVAWRDSIKADYKLKHGYSLTYTPILVQVVVQALKKFPQINVSLLPNNQLVLKKYINIGIATALPDRNLIVPVIKEADFKSLNSLTKEIYDLTNRARNQQLKPGETADGTFTITNLGQTGNISGTPIINQPESAILAAGAIKKKPGVVKTHGELAIGIRDVLTLSLSYDHRVIDGALGGTFLSYIAELLESYKPSDL